MSSQRPPLVKHLVLDTGPLLSLAPLRGISEHFYTVPQVVGELRDKRGKEYLERLALSGVSVQIKTPDVAAIAEVTKFARKTGDYSVLSQADILVLALTYSLNGEETRNLEKEIALVNESTSSQDVPSTHVEEGSEGSEPSLVEEEEAEEESSSSSDGEGEWITPSNVVVHKSRALNLVPAASSTASGDAAQTKTACMTADFAMQNVLLQLGLGLVDVEGKRISAMKSWVLRCHACFKICRNMSKKFCPSCGGATLLRASVSVSTPSNGQPSTMKVHLKKGFQYRNRGTKYSIPQPQPGSSKTGSGEGLILREDQVEWMRAEKREKTRQEKESRKIADAIQSAKEGEGAKIGSWMDPDWLPDMLSVGISGKGRNTGGGMPNIGHGRSNPNARRRRR